MLYETLSSAAAT